MIRIFGKSFILFCVMVFVCFFSVGVQLLFAQQSIETDSLYVYDFNSRTFSAYSVNSDIHVTSSVIGESRPGATNTRVLSGFDNYVNPDTTILQRVAMNYDQTVYPFSAAVKLQQEVDGELEGSCSGFMISDYWVATANHCYRIRETHFNSWSPDSISTIYASPSFDSGNAFPAIGTIKVNRAIFFSGATQGLANDLIFLRLDEPLGRLSGTIGMSSLVINDIEASDVALSFGYPAIYLNHKFMPDIFDNIYDAQELYFSQNKVSRIDEAYILTRGHSNRGQSGSPVLFYRQGAWKSYGVLSMTSFSESRYHRIGEITAENISELMLDIDAGDLPAKSVLDQNYPNPFNSGTIINYEIPFETNVVLEVFDVLGRRVATLQNGVQSAGWYSVRWDARNYSSGVYIYRLTSGNEVLTGKMTLIK